MSREPYKFDPERAERSDRTEFQEFLPNRKVLNCDHEITPRDHKMGEGYIKLRDLG